MKRILVTFALPWEGRRWRPYVASRPRRQSKAQWQQGDVEVVAVATGMGAVRASRCVSEMLQRSAFDLCISTGFAGALRADWRPGALVVAQEVAEEATGQRVPLADTWVELAARAGAQPGRLLTCAQVVTWVEQRRRLAEQADAVDMESYAIVTTVGRYGVPLVVVRAISDGCDGDLPARVEECLDEQGRLRAARLLRALGREPVSVIRLGIQARRAADRLAEFLDRFLPAAAEQLAAPVMVRG